MSWTEDWLRELLAAASPREIVLTLMRTGSRLLEAEAATFVPFAEWRSALKPLTLGPAPLPPERTALPAVRYQCRTCATLHGGEACQLIHALETPANVWCLPLEKGGRRLGVVNFFLRPGAAPSSADNETLRRLQSDAWLALEALQRYGQQAAPLLNWQREAGLEALLRAGARLLGAQAAALYLDDWVTEGGRRLWLTAGPAAQGFPSTPVYWRQLQEAAAAGPVCRPQENGWLCLFPLAQDGDLNGLLVLLAAGEEAPPTDWQETAQALAAALAERLRSERALSARVAAAAAAERRHLAREIHDGLAQTMAYLQLEANRIQRLLDRGETERAAAAVAPLLAALDDASSGIRQELESLRTAADDRPFAAWLQAFVQDFSRSQDNTPQIYLNITLKTPIPTTASLHLKRIVQEALSNIRRHAAARQVHLSLHETETAWLLTIRDDGRGCDCAAAPPGRYGLLGMRERAEALGADLQFESRPGQGTTIRLRLPFSAVEAA